MCEMKKCTTCKRELPKTNEYFFKNSKTNDKLMSQCKECMGYKFQDFKKKYDCTEGYKICRSCNHELPLNHDHFYYNNVSLDGFDYSCRVCSGYKYGKTICEDGYKICIKCESELLLNKENFHVDNSNKDGFDNVCKNCKFNRNEEDFSIREWYELRSKQFKSNWDFQDIKWMYENYRNITKQELLDYFSREKSYKTLTNIIYQWNIKKKDKNDNWTKEDIQFLHDNYPNMQQSELEDHFKGRTWISIKAKASKLSIHRDEETLFAIRSESHKGIKLSEETRKKLGLARRGENNHGWKGGISPITVRLRDFTAPWKIDSLKEYNFNCALLGMNDRTLEVHHLYKNFSELVYETFDLLELPLHNDMSLYTQEQRDSIRDKLLELHYKNGLGVPLSKKLHQLFHSLYGNRNNNKEQFEEFKKRYEFGEFNEVLIEVS